jgi:serine/threonine-protein phosphatase 2A activator
MAQALPQLREISLSQLSRLSTPTTGINRDDDVERWKNSKSYRDYAIFLRRLNESVVGYFLPWESGQPSKVVGSLTRIACMRSDPLHQAIQSLLKLLDTLDEWIEEIPPLESPQRFGNLAFRTWGRRLEEVGVSR